MKAFPSCPFVTFVFRWFLQRSQKYKFFITTLLPISHTGYNAGAAFVAVHVLRSLQYNRITHESGNSFVFG